MSPHNEYQGKGSAFSKAINPDIMVVENTAKIRQDVFSSCMFLVNIISRKRHGILQATKPDITVVDKQQNETKCLFIMTVPGEHNIKAITQHTGGHQTRHHGNDKEISPHHECSWWS